MNRPSRPRATADLSDSIHRKLNMYAVAASAAGVGMLAFGQPAEARVVYTPAHKWLPLNQYYYLDLNHDGVNDFEFKLESNVRSTGFFYALSVAPGAKSKRGNGVYSYQSFSCDNRGSGRCASALPKGREVGRQSPFWSNNPAFMFVYANGSKGSQSYFGPWLSLKEPAYLGLKFTIKGKIHYGWARLGQISHRKPAKVELLGYAYETIPNKSITAGKTKGPDVITMQPDSLGGLALGRQ